LIDYGNELKKKQFDAVKMIREIRDKISTETQNMTFEELKAYIKKKLEDNPSKLIGQP
jgi:CO dehydrogenase/acetyl-CoA synthase beta subunit